LGSFDVHDVLTLIDGRPELAGPVSTERARLVRDRVDELLA
jgi:hypothetical protein